MIIESFFVNETLASAFRSERGNFLYNLVVVLTKDLSPKPKSFSALAADVVEIWPRFKLAAQLTFALYFVACDCVLFA